MKGLVFDTVSPPRVNETSRAAHKKFRSLINIFVPRTPPELISEPVFGAIQEVL